MNLIEQIQKNIHKVGDMNSEDIIPEIYRQHEYFKRPHTYNHIVCGYELYLKFKELEDDKDEFR